VVQCLSAACGKEILDTWSFCAHCGADNRAPDARSKVTGCTHEYAEEEPFCIKCGFNRNPPAKSARSWDWVEKDRPKLDGRSPDVPERETFLSNLQIEPWVILVVVAVIIFFGAFFALAQLAGHKRNDPTAERVVAPNQ